MTTQTAPAVRTVAASAQEATKRYGDGDTAVMLIAPTSPVDPATVAALRAAPGILSVAALQA